MVLNELIIGEMIYKTNIDYDWRCPISICGFMRIGITITGKMINRDKMSDG